MKSYNERTTTVKSEERAEKRTEAATFVSMTNAHRIRSERLEAGRQATAAFLGEDTGDVIFA